MASKDKKDKAPKGGIRSILLLTLLLFVSAAITVFIVSPSVRGRALGLFAEVKGAAASLGDGIGSRGRSGSAGAPRWGGGDITLKIQNNIVDKFSLLEMREADYEIRYLPKDSTISINAAVPRGRPMEWIIWNIADAARSTPYEVEDCLCARPAQCVITFRSSNPKHPKVAVNMRQSGRYLSNTARMAILVENFGFEADKTTVEYLSFPEPLTVSLVPAQRLAEWTAQIAGEYKKEVVLLLPMEPLPPQFSEYRRSMITVHQSEEAVRAAIAQAAAAIPNFKGISSFHGSRVMEDSRVMGIILSETTRRNAYFVYTDARRSVVPSLARDMRVPARAFQGSIDAEHNEEQIRERLRRYAMTAEKTGQVLIKTQPTQTFIQVLKEEIDALRRNGIRLVYVSELM